MSTTAEAPGSFRYQDLERLFDSTSYSMRVPQNNQTSRPVEWRVEVYPDGNMIFRRVWYENERWWPMQQRWDAEGIIWPTWPERSQDEIAAAGTPLADTQEYWSTAGNRLRDAAKWTATVLGAGLAALVGTSPLRGMNEHPMPSGAKVLGITGIVLVGLTLTLVLRVMCPNSVSLDDVEDAKPRRFMPDRAWLRSPLYKWQRTIESEQDLYLPCGITSIKGLRQSMSIEECTLMALSLAGPTACSKKARKDIHAAQTARAARLLELRTAAARVAMIGEYYNLKRRSIWATHGGVFLGVLATICIVVAFAWPVN
jgi:hypothetical protein